MLMDTWIQNILNQAVINIRLGRKKDMSRVESELRPVKTTTRDSVLNQIKLETQKRLRLNGLIR